MANELRFDGKVVIITGAGNGLGRSHALLFGSRGAKVVVNDLGGGHTGGGKSSAAADKVVEEIKAAGGEAVANYDSVEDGGKIVQTAMDTWKRIDIVVNNAGILRDTSFIKMTDADWDLIMKVHVQGAYKVTHAAFPYMREQGYGRIIMTASAAGIYGNFGQTNYALAKLGLVGFSNTLAIEGGKKNVHCNTIAPIAGSRMTETVLPPELIDALKPELVSPLVAYLCHESCEENGGLFEVGGGFFSKLRWERTKGEMFRLGRKVTVENVQKSWPKITSFENADHPADITSSLGPIMGNVQAGKSRGGNEFIDVDAAMSAEIPVLTSKYDERDLSIYALGVGAANDPTDDQELQLVYEMHGNGFKALPTFGVVPALNAMLAMAKEGKQPPGLNYGFDRILHGEQYTEIKRPLPPKATLTHKSRIKDIFDKGKNALVVTETRSYDENGEELIVNEITTFVRGAGGWGGDRGPSTDINVAPDRKPDAVIEEKIPANQALLYRLSGDWNPLHADPNFAGAFGFSKPILHGLCTFGYAGRHVIKAFAPKGDPSYFKSIKTRFADSVFPGETIITEMWKESDQKIIFRCKVKERDKTVISNAAIELYKEIPKPVSKKATLASTPNAKAASSAAASSGGAGEPNSADVFAGIAKFIEKNADTAKKIGVVYLFKLTGPDSEWTIDLKTGAGVKQGAGEKPECTLEMSNSDFMDMCTGKADAQKLYFGGKLKISGNVMASQKLEFLKKIDPNDVLAATKARGGSASPDDPACAANAVPAGDVPADAGAADVFIAIADHVERNPDLTKIGMVYQFKITSPDTVWTLDVKNGKGSVSAGETVKPDCTLELSNADFMDMTSGKADPQKLYFGGKLKISGNVMASQKLQFLQKIDPEQAKAAVLKARASGGGPKAVAATSTAKGPDAKTVFSKLKDRLGKNANLAKEVNAVLGFKVDGVEYIVDLKNGAGSVTEGTAKGADAVLTITTEDLVALASGSASAQALFQQGKLKVDGDVRPAHKLGFLNGVLS
ncbi:MAG: Oxidoreductase, short chain dehydrogenase/reductase family protein [Myxococcaceae bacterium]|nr:Oxidoreductase, short chain dehydrogenase/reductase family protein [Myxococcaceae bacterium]